MRIYNLQLSATLSLHVASDLCPEELCGRTDQDANHGAWQ